MKKKYLLLDRDETLNLDPGYLNDASIVELKEGVVKGLQLLQEFNFHFFIITNQSGVSRGLISQDQLKAVNARLLEILKSHNIKIEKFYICTHRDEDNCNCRKPKSGLIEQFFTDYPQAKNDCYIAGDKMRDIKSGESNNIPGILLSKTSNPNETKASNLEFTCDTLTEAAAFILEREFNNQLDFSHNINPQEVKLTIDSLKKEKKKIVFTNGCFDILHTGHLQYLWQASQLGDYFILGLNSDASVKNLKGDNRPINKSEDRIKMLSCLNFIDKVIVFDEATPQKLLELIKPNIHIKGGDYKAEDLPEKETVEQNGGRIIILPFRKGYSTTNLVKKIKNEVV